MIEKELKIMLSKFQYYELLKYFDVGTQKIQKNYYFDDEFYSLFKKDITCRIRKREENLFLQVKYPSKIEETYVQKKEYTVKIHSFPRVLEQAFLASKGIFFNIQDRLNIIGVLETLRYEKEIDKYTKIVLDKNVYLGMIDYELEIEFQNENNLITTVEQLEKLDLGLNTINKIGKRTRLFNKIFLDKGIIL